MRRSFVVAFVAGAGCFVGLACGGYGESDREAPTDAGDARDAGEASLGEGDGGTGDDPTSVTLGIAVLQGKASGLEIFFDNAFVELR